MEQVQELRLVRQGFEKIAPWATVLSGALVWLYAMGWCYESVYLTRFGASWLIYQFPAAKFLTVDFLPVIIVVICTAAMAQMVHHEPLRKYKFTHFKWSAWIILVLYLIVTTASIFVFLRIQTFFFALGMVIVGEMFFALTCLMLFLAISNRLFALNVPSVVLSLLALVISVGHLPAAKGVTDALNAAQHGKADPPIVRLKNDTDPTEKRLLLHANGLFYLAKMNPSPLHPEVLIVSPQEIAAISGYPAPAALP